MEKDITLFAKTNFRNKERIFGIKRKDRRQHTYIVGKTGTGKTTLLFNLAIQDIIKGEGICIVDQHGDFVETIITKIPRERIKDVVYFNPIDAEYPIGFNVLEVPDQKYKHLVASDLMAIFTKIWANVWSARMEYILNNCVLALLDTPGSTLLGIPRILTNKDYRQKIIANIKDPIVKSFWIYEYESWRDQFRNEAIVPIQNKVGQFLSTSLIRNIVGQSKSTINIQEIMNTGKILLVNLSKGKLGEDNSALLGAMMITKIQLAAMERARVPEEERKDFYLHIDEFQSFVTDSFATILSEARKYRLNLVISHQYIGQLISGTSTKVKDAIFGNVGTMIIFRVGAADAEFLEKELEPDFNIQDMANLPNFHIYLKLMVDGATSRPFSAITLPPLSMANHESNHEEVIEISRKNYANSLEEAEEEFSRWSGITTEKAPDKKAFDDKRPFEKRPREQVKFKYASNLGEIGIEFEAPKKVSSFEKIGRRLAGETEEKKHYLSLEELKKKEMPKKAVPYQPLTEKKEKEQMPKSTIEELKEAIKKAIGGE